MSEIPELALSCLICSRADGGRLHPMVPFSDAESAIRSALDRQAREIVEALPSVTPPDREGRMPDLIALNLTGIEAHDLHHAISITVQLLREVGVGPGAPLTPESEDRLMIVARRLDHERHHHGAVPNPHAPKEADPR